MLGYCYIEIEKYEQHNKLKNSLIFLIKIKS